MKGWSLIFFIKSSSIDSWSLLYQLLLRKTFHQDCEEIWKSLHKVELLYTENINELNLNVFSLDINLPVVWLTKTFYFTNGNKVSFYYLPHFGNICSMLLCFGHKMLIRWVYKKYPMLNYIFYISWIL